MDNFALFFGIVLLSACIIAVAIVTYDIKRYDKFIASIKVGDIFVWSDKVYLYHKWNYEDKNPFIDKSETTDEKIYPDSSFVIKDLKYNNDGELWAAYTFIKNENDIKREDKLLFYREINDLVKYYTIVEHYE